MGNNKSVKGEGRSVKLPDGWQERTLGDVIITNDATYSKKDKWKFINYLDTGNLTENQISEVQYLVVGEDKIPSRAKRKVEPGDIVYSTVRPNQKHYGILKNPVENLLVSTGFVTIRAKEEADTNFIYWFLVQPEIIERLQTIGEHSTSAYPSIKPSDIEGLKVNLPPLPEQKAIAHILGSLDDKIELNRRMNETLEAMAQALFKSWFVDFDPFIDNILLNNRNQNQPSPPAPLPKVEGSLTDWDNERIFDGIPDELRERAEIRRAILAQNQKGENDPDSSPVTLYRSHFPSEFEHTEEMGWIPKGWKVSTVESVIEINPTVKLPKNTVAPFVDMKALPTTGYSVGEIIEKPYVGGAKFQNGDILLARITPCLENGKTAIADFLDGDQIGFGSTEFIILRGQGSVGTPFVACLSRNGKFRDHCIQSMVGSSGRQRVQNACFSNFFLPLPKGHDLLKEFHSRTEGSFNKITKHSEQSRVLAKLRDTLLPKLMSGEIRIPEAEKLVEDLDKNGGQNA